MCLTAATALMIGGAALSATQSIMQIQQANSQAQAIARNTEDALGYDYNILARRQTEINKKSTMEAMERQRQGLKERAKLTVAMGEAGVSGNSPLRQINNSFLQEGYDKGIIEENRESGIRQTMDMEQQSYAIAKSRLNYAKSMTVDPMTGLLKTGLSTVSGLLMGKSMSNSLGFSTGSSGSTGFSTASSLNIPEYQPLQYNGLYKEIT